MATSLLALIDDVASVLDDVAVLTKVAAKKTAGVLGDDLALNAQQVTGVRTDRELPVVWAVAKGSLRNKAILVPAALIISAAAPWAVIPLLMIGGAYLCFEGFEKVAHKLVHSHAEQAADQAHHAQHLAALANPTVDLVALEKDKIKGAVRTDFILSAEIIAITLGTVATSPFATRLTVLTAIALVMTVGVYGVVAGIVKLDDAGLHLSRADSRPQRALGAAIVKAAPYLLKSLSVAGTVAMFLVGGGILSHGIPPLHHLLERLEGSAGAISGVGGVLAALTPLVLDAVVGLVAGGLVVGAVTLVKRLIGSKPHRRGPTRS
jgi:predicted DNA repair protein MutK